MSVLWTIGITVVLGIIIIGIIWSVVVWSHNNSKPQINFEARVVRIRDRDWFVRRGTSYYFNTVGKCSITFELLSDSKRIKLKVPLYELEKIEEADTGILTLQGTRYINFIRHL